MTTYTIDYGYNRQLITVTSSPHQAIHHFLELQLPIDDIQGITTQSHDGAIPLQKEEVDLALQTATTIPHTPIQ